MLEGHGKVQNEAVPVQFHVHDLGIGADEMVDLLHGTPRVHCLIALSTKFMRIIQSV